ncbi:MAG: hypothetical protein IPO85_16375 [Saprospiraceae bacterium]|jgi:septal ring factor EnvC (AmiA/AmiB activator)|uniref:Lipoprotein n=1 Tax=Candidatus Defluviibacterium haderslevense TaxID=2981993 RepID=A0A9D7SAJ0_9BACT|nr:hypothetical protein [Candidatus Defluviibacterium haderslevense]MBK9719055.1 hypothetical protein [Candidatus Defluviibacterium haderslevense]MCC7025392.1 hypothetical protein [Saprospiraceae bacterium]MCI1267860.1 hypothetical protein [Saprospiraceae bacterium]HRI32630.1 hypothetical protein [Saprospiraceae bacterium]
MKNSIPILVLMFTITACVPMKKHKALILQYSDVNAALKEKNDINTSLSEQLDKCNALNEFNTSKIKDLEAHIKFAESNNTNLTTRIGELSGSTKTNAEVLQRALAEIYDKDEQITELSNILKKKDSVNVILVKKVSKSITNKRFRKSLEKIGLVF